MTDTYAVIGKLKIEKIEGAKTLQMGWYGGLPYAVSKDVTENDLVVIFLPDGQVSQQYADEHDLVTKTVAGKVVNKGYFGKNRKVRPIKLMKGKIRSVGLVMPLDSLAFTGYNISDLKEGDSFNELNGVPICNKYINPATLNRRNAQSSGEMKHKREEIGLSMHPDTKQFYRFIDTLEAGDKITISLKLDGTSVRIGNAFIPVKKNWFVKLLSKFFPIADYQNSVLTGTRRVIIGRTDGDGYYNDHLMYLEVAKRIEHKLRPGEAVYGEIVGWLNETTPLFNRGGVIFKYGCPAGERDFYVYNITQTLPNGEVLTLPWNEVKARCTELGVKHVLEMQLEWNTELEYYGVEWPVLDGWSLKDYDPTFFYNGDQAQLESLVFAFAEGFDPIDHSHIREGVVLRVERKHGGVSFFKCKSEDYYALEDASKSDDKFVDIEEVESGDGPTHF